MQDHVFKIPTKKQRPKDHMKSKYLHAVGGYVLTIVLLLSLLAGQTARAATVAYWQFEPGKLGADSSGNGNTLNITNITSSADVAAGAPGTGSAVFNGDAFAQTTAPLTLSGYTNFTLEWMMKSSGTAFGIVMETSPNYNSYGGALLVDVNETGPSRAVVAEDTAGGGYYNKQFQFPTDGTWNHYAVTIDANDTTTNRMLIYLNGVNVHLSNDSLATIAAPFGDYVFNIGGRNFGAWGFTGQLDEIKISDQILTPSQFEYHFTGDSIAISQQPTNTMVALNQTATFYVAVTVNNAPQNAIAYQWQRSDDNGTNWADIPGANSAIYTTAVVSNSDNNARFRVSTKIPLGASSKTSQMATLTVNPDNIPPYVVSAASIEGQNFGITFDGLVDPVSATNPSNYAINGTTVTNVVLLSDGLSVQLQTTTNVLGSSFSGTISQVKDLAGNTMSNNSPVSGPIMGVTIYDIGNSAAFSSVTPFFFSSRSNQYDVYTGAGNTAGVADQAFVLYLTRTNDFDVCVNVVSLKGGGTYGRGALFVRESLAPGSRDFNIGCYQPSAVGFVLQPYARLTTDMGSSAPYPGGFVLATPSFNYSNVWLRLERSAGVLTEYYGTNGLDWTAMGTADVSGYPSAMYVGMLLDPESTTAPLDIVYRNFGSTFSPPRILVQPSSAGVIEGGSNTFSVTAAGAAPLNYQWFKNGAFIPDATNASYIVTNVQLADSGNIYTVGVSNKFGTLLSNGAKLHTGLPYIYQDVRIGLNDIQVFDVATLANHNRGDQGNAIDNNLTTWTYLTGGGVTTAQNVAVGFSNGLQSVNRIRVAKESSDIDGTGHADSHMNIRVVFTTDAGPLTNRTYQPVTGLWNGWEGTETFNAISTFADDSVIGEFGNVYGVNGYGYYSLSFDKVNATAIALQLVRTGLAGEYSYVNYPVYEIEAYNEVRNDVLSGTSSAGKINLSWSASLMGYSLQSAAQVSGIPVWNAVTNAPMLVGTNYHVTLSAPGKPQYFRLKK